jgi:5-methylcytosine-specific restriction endonuclease McrA
MNRDVMISYFPAENKPRELQRYRRNFTRLQRRTWKAQNCVWCKSTDGLELDHIISVIAGGTNVKANCQTLCKSCNLWKSIFIDKPFYLAKLAIQGGS